MNKPIKPDITIPQSFAENGVKTDFDDTLLANGFDNLRPDVLAGDNLNKFIDDTYQGLNYSMAAADAINLINEGETLTVKEGQLVSDKISGGTSLPLGAPVIMDRVLSYEESKGYALQGTYVYKEAIAGSRYGYPDFYNKCVEEKEAATPTETTLGDNTVTLYINSNGHRFYDIADKTAIDAWYETYGIADFYGVDTENERIFLPRNKYFMQLTDDTTKVNEMVEAGLPNITGRFGNWPRAYVTQIGTGAFTVIEEGGGYGYNTGGGVTSYSTFDASNSNTIYGNSDTVQPPSSLKLLYYVVGNTTATEALTNVTDITTSENDTLPWGYNFYSGEFLEPALGYVASNGQWLSGADWTTFYNKAVAKIGQSFAGGVIVEHTSDYTDYDLVLNQDDMTFRLPLLNGDRVLVDKKEATDDDPTWYNLYSDGWCEQGSKTDTLPDNATLEVALLKDFVNAKYSITTSERSDNNPSDTNNENYWIYAVNTNSFVLYNSAGAYKQVYWQASGYTLIPTNAKIKLYFKLANALQNQELLDVAKVTEVFSQLTDVAAVIVDSYRNGASWYRVYSDGWCEQGGQIDNVSTGQITVSLLKNYINTNYSIQKTNGGKNASHASADLNDNFYGIWDITTSSFTTSTYNSVLSGHFMWQACGYIA